MSGRRFYMKVNEMRWIERERRHFNHKIQKSNFYIKLDNQKYNLSISLQDSFISIEPEEIEVSFSAQWIEEISEILDGI